MMNENTIRINVIKDHVGVTAVTGSENNYLELFAEID